MAFIGNTVQNQGFTPAIDYFNGNGVTVTFTLSRPIASVAQVIVAVDNVIQNPSSAFNVVGNSITFTSAPLSGTNNIWVEYTSLITTYQGISQDPTVIGDIRATGGYLAEGDFGNSFIDGNLIDYVTGRGRFTVGELDDITFYHGGTSARSAMMDLYYAGGAKVYGTTALTIPVGTTAERPGTPAVGMLRFNTTNGYLEYYSSIDSAWHLVTNTSTAPYTVEYLVVAGGGSGGGNYLGGGGGAGGYVTSSATLTPSTGYGVVIGSGGTAPANGVGSNGSNSSFLTTTSIGGGGGGQGATTAGSGGSGGGSGANGIPSNFYGSGTAGQGNRGGSGYDGTVQFTCTGGGGGAGAIGGDSGTSSANVTGGNGGVGLQWLNGTFYAGGGGGSGDQGANPSYGGTFGTGGNGGGGNGGSWNTSTYPTAGSANTGGGGGGGTRVSSNGTPGANGGSGVVIIRYAGSQRGTGGTYSSSGGYSYHTFTSSGTYTA